MNILITGGASGLGEAITKSLATSKENKVYFTYNKSEKKAASIVGEFQNTIAIKCDFSIEDELKILLSKIAMMNLDVLINNAYCSRINQIHFHKVPIENFQIDFAINIVPTILITQEVIKIFRKKKSGKIITILSSALTNVPPLGYSVYVANKAYLEKLTKVWACENSKFNITSNSISPSFMQTAINNDVDERVIEEIINSNPQKKLLSIDEVAETVSFFVHASSHINGVDLLMNAGINIK